MTETGEKPSAESQETLRTSRGRAIAATPGAIERAGRDVFTVRSQSGPGAYRVEITPKGEVCNCPDYVKRGGLPCKHSLSVRFFLGVETEHPDGSLTTQRIPLTYSQAWSAYNDAQTQELRLFDILLSDLVASVNDPRPVKATGRPLTPLKEELFCSVQKVASGLSCRRAKSLFGFAKERGQIPGVPSYSVSSRVLNDPAVTAILQNLIAASALPLASLEHDFSPDSTGFRTTCFGAWNGEKHGERKVNKWLKAHALCGTNTHVVVRVEVTDQHRDGADYSKFQPLLRDAARDFDIEEVYADKAYTGRSNYALAEEMGFDLYSPFKSRDKPNPTSMRRDSHGNRVSSRLWRDMYHYVQLHREEWEGHYHQRSNVESVFSAVKRKFGETLKSKNYAAQVNELLAKILAYNITVLIHEMFEHGVVPDFLQGSPGSQCRGS